MIFVRSTFLLMLAIAPFTAGCSRPVANASTQSARLTDKTFDDLEFEMAENATFERSFLTPKVEELFGKQIRIRGFMYPTLKKSGLKTFVLIRDNQNCCFGPGAKLYHNIMVNMRPGETAEYELLNSITVEGTFRYELVEFDGYVVSIYQLENASVK